MWIDMHMHEKTYSSDSHLSLEEIVSRAKILGLDAVCITDHESNQLTERAKEYSEEVGFPILVGYEYLTDKGDILVFGVRDVPKYQCMPVDNFLEMVKGEGGIAIAAHPFRKNNRGLGDYLYKAENLYGIECLNGSTPEGLNRMAYEIALERGLHTTGASDCHVPEKIGRYATSIPDGVKTVEDLVKVFKNKKSEIFPGKWTDKGYEKVDILNLDREDV